MSGPSRREDRSQGEEVQRDAVERARRTSEEIESRLAALAASVARTEEALADAYEDSARVRPHAADHLEDAAREARAFAAHEREESRRRAGSGDGTDPSDLPS